MSKHSPIVLALGLALGTFGGATSAAEPTAKAAAAAVSKLRIEGNDQMKFNVAELRVKAGATVELTLAHTGKLPKAAMGHNWVLLKKGTDVAAFANAAMSAVGTDYIPAAKADEVIAFTKVIGGGEEARVSFTAPAAGEYDFICSFPGHFALMKGKLIVEG